MFSIQLRISLLSIERPKTCSNFSLLWLQKHLLKALRYMKFTCICYCCYRNICWKHYNMKFTSIYSCCYKNITITITIYETHLYSPLQSAKSAPATESCGQETAGAPPWQVTITITMGQWYIREIDHPSPPHPLPKTPHATSATILLVPICFWCFWHHKVWGEPSRITK